MSDTESPPFSSHRASILAVGDSLTQNGFKDNGWLAQLAAHYCRKLDVINRGFSGHTTRSIHSIVSKELEQNGLLGTFLPVGIPSVVLVWLGANDSVLASSGGGQHVPLDEFQSNLVYVTHEIHKSYHQGNSTGPHFILLTPPPICEAKRLEHQLSKFGDAATGVSERSNANTKLYSNRVKMAAKQLTTLGVKVSRQKPSPIVFSMFLVGV